MIYSVQLSCNDDGAFSNHAMIELGGWDGLEIILVTSRLIWSFVVGRLVRKVGSELLLSFQHTFRRKRLSPFVVPTGARRAPDYTVVFLFKL